LSGVLAGVQGAVVLGRTALGPMNLFIRINASAWGLAAALYPAPQSTVDRHRFGKLISNLNSQRIIPYRDHAVAHGDKLILGTLHLTIFFSQKQ
jgi:hypothetical protein